MAAELPRISTQLPGPKASALIERDAAVLSPSYTRPYPFVMARGDGAIVEDVDGNRFLDCNAGIAVVATGHAHPHVVKAMQEQAAKFLHMSGTDFYYENMVDLAEKLASLAPGDTPRRVYFGNSGTEAIEAAMKMARYSHGRQQFIAFFGSFHGRTLGALSLDRAARTSRRKDSFRSCPACITRPIRTAIAARSEPRRIVAPSSASAISKTRSCGRWFQPEEIAAIFLEPVQGEGGYIVPPQKFIDELQRSRGKPRHPARFRRSAIRHGPHRQDVRGRALRRAARHHRARERHCQRHAAFGDDRARRHHGLEARVARLDLRWQSRFRRRLAGDHRACWSGTDAKAAARIGATCIGRMRDWPASLPRSSATCAGSG